MVSRSSEISDKHHYLPVGKIKVAHGHDEGSWQDPVSELAMFQGLQHVSANHLVHVCRDEKVVFAELGGWSKHSLDSLQSCFLLINLIHPNILFFRCLINNFIWLSFHKSWVKSFDFIQFVYMIWPYAIWQCLFVVWTKTWYDHENCPKGMYMTLVFGTKSNLSVSFTDCHIIGLFL